MSKLGKIVPVNLFECRYNSFSSLSDPMSAGMVPVSELEWKSITVVIIIEAMEKIWGAIRPANMFVCREMYSRSIASPKLSGIDPVS